MTRALPRYLLSVRILLAGLIAAISSNHSLAAETDKRPNIIIVLADDMGWRDTGYAGSADCKTPVLDDMAAHGARFDYFYAAQQMCSPGRFALLTGRTPFRSGIYQLQNIREQERTLARTLKEAGYQTGQFGKWHLGSGPRSPIGMGFDEAVWKPNFFDLNTTFQRGDDSKATVETTGDGSVAIMNIALDYIRRAAKEPKPFFTYINFGSPHSPHVGAEEFKKLHPNANEKQLDYVAEISGIDAAVGNLRAELKKLGIANNTILWFTSDNGGIRPLSQDPAGKGKMNIGVRTVSVLEWPAKITSPKTVTMPCGHVDMYATLLEMAGVPLPKDQPVQDGSSVAQAIVGDQTERTKPLGFLLWQGGGRGKNNPATKKFDDVDFTSELQGVWIDGKYKLRVTPQKNSEETTIELFDIVADEAEKKNLATDMPEQVATMRAALKEWQQSVRASYDGKDFAAK